MAVLFSASSPFFSVNTVTHESQHKHVAYVPRQALKS